MKKYLSWAPSLFAIATIAFGIIQLVAGDFNKGLLPVSPALPGKTVLVYCSGILLVLSGSGMLVNRWRRAAALTTAMLWLIFLVFLHLIKLSIDIYNGGEWTATFEVVLLCSGAFIIARELPAISKYALALCLVVFAVLHFQYAGYIATLVPGWIPFKLFWAYFIGVAFLLTAISICVNVLVVQSTFLIGLMFLIWVLVLHIPRAFAATQSEPEWTSLFVAAAACAILFTFSNHCSAGNGGSNSGKSL